MITNTVDAYILQHNYYASTNTVLVYAGLWRYAPGISITYPVVRDALHFSAGNHGRSFIIRATEHWFEGYG